MDGWSEFLNQFFNDNSSALLTKIAYEFREIKFELNDPESGIKDENIILDPGIGFGKTVEHNLILLQRLNEFTDLGFPLLIGTSRKSFIGKISDLPAEERLEGTIASNVLAVMMGAKMVSDPSKKIEK